MTVPLPSVECPAPMRVRDEIIEVCRVQVEKKWKRQIRRLAQGYIEYRSRISRAGEGLQWGTGLSLGSYTAVGRFCYLGARLTAVGPLVVGDLSLISTDVKIVGNDHAIDTPGLPIRLGPRPQRAVTVVEADCWIGKAALIREGVTIGRGSVVGAGAMVSRSVPPYTVVAGVPARVLRRRFTEDEAVHHDELLFGECRNLLFPTEVTSSTGDRI